MGAANSADVSFSDDWIAVIPKVFLMVIVCLCLTSPVMAGGHQRLVRQSGITPRQVGSAEGVGMSTRSYTDARNNACYWGRKTPVSIQYSKRGPYYYAVVRYR